eukprot:scaffold2371_cov113-Amphora_coffeaeformis.AAC.2
MADNNTIRASWLKQLLQDIEESSLDIRKVSLPYLSSKRPAFYGPKLKKKKGEPEVELSHELKEKRRKISLKLSDLKRICARSPKAYKAILLKNRVTTGPITKSFIKLEEEGLYDMKKESKQTMVSDIMEQMENLGVEEDEDVTTPAPAPPQPILTPPRGTTLTPPR